MFTIYSDIQTMRKWRMSYVLDEREELRYSSRVYHDCVRWLWEQGECRYQHVTPEFKAIILIEELDGEPPVLTTEPRLDGRNPLPDPQ